MFPFYEKCLPRCSYLQHNTGSATQSSDDIPLSQLSKRSERVSNSDSDDIILSQLANKSKNAKVEDQNVPVSPAIPLQLDEVPTVPLSSPRVGFCLSKYFFLSIFCSNFLQG